MLNTKNNKGCFSLEFKNIIKNEDLRYKLANILRFIPDKLMIKFMYRFKTNRKLNLRNPQRFTEKIQWYKLNYRNPLMKICTDKFLVRDFVSEKGYSEILNEIYGVYESPNDIDFDSLPNEFIIKMTSGSGGNIIIEDKNNTDIDSINSRLTNWLKNRPANIAGEWAYNEDSKIIIEKLLPMDENNDLIDYKFFCFNGKVDCLYVMVDYVHNTENGKCSFYDLEFNKLPYHRTDFPPINRDVVKPKNFGKMIEIAKVLSQGFPHVRVDLFNIEGEIYFGEMTFYNASGFVGFVPDEFDFILGEKLNLNI